MKRRFKDKAEFTAAMLKGPLYNNKGHKAFFNPKEGVSPFVVQYKGDGQVYLMNNTWEDFGEEWSTHPPIEHGQPVMAWCDKSIGEYAGMFLGVYDAKNGNVHITSKLQIVMEHIIPYEGECPDILKKLIAKVMELPHQ
jgi:hypothetical protein